MKTVLRIIGSIRTRIFVSSICVTVQSFQDPEAADSTGPSSGVIIAA